MSIARTTMLDVEDGVPKRSYSRKKREERPERNYIVMPRMFQVPLLEAEKTGKKVSSLMRVESFISKLLQGNTGANSRKRQRSPDDDGDDMRDVSTPTCMKSFNFNAKR
jgi:hypothetical protein